MEVHFLLTWNALYLAAGFLLLRHRGNLKTELPLQLATWIHLAYSFLYYHLVLTPDRTGLLENLVPPFLFSASLVVMLFGSLKHQGMEKTASWILGLFTGSAGILFLGFFISLQGGLSPTLGGKVAHSLFRVESVVAFSLAPILLLVLFAMMNLFRRPGRSSSLRHYIDLQTLHRLIDRS